MLRKGGMVQGLVEETISYCVTHVPHSSTKLVQLNAATCTNKHSTDQILRDPVHYPNTKNGSQNAPNIHQNTQKNSISQPIIHSIVTGV